MSSSKPLVPTQPTIIWARVNLNGALKRVVSKFKTTFKRSGSSPATQTAFAVDRSSRRFHLLSLQLGAPFAADVDFDLNSDKTNKRDDDDDMSVENAFRSPSMRPSSPVFREVRRDSLATSSSAFPDAWWTSPSTSTVSTTTTVPSSLHIPVTEPVDLSGVVARAFLDGERCGECGRMWGGYRRTKFVETGLRETGPLGTEA